MRFVSPFTGRTCLRRLDEDLDGTGTPTPSTSSKVVTVLTTLEQIVST